MRGVRREAVFIVMRYKNTDLPGDENIQKCRPVGCGTPVHRQIVVISSSLGRWEDCFVSYATKRILGKQSARSALRHEGRHGRREEAGRGDWRYEKRGDRYQAIVPCHMWWTRRGSNPRPSACKAAAPPIELLARVDIYNISSRRRERNWEIPSSSYLRKSSDVAKLADDYQSPRSSFRRPSPSKLIVECLAKRFAGRRGEEAGGESAIKQNYDTRL